MLLRTDGLRTPVETTVNDVVDRRMSSHVDTAAADGNKHLSEFNDVIHSFSSLCFGLK